MNNVPTAQKPEEETSEAADRWLTLPNMITALRIVGSPVLIWLGVTQQPIALAVLTGLLIITEWLDGFLARRLHLESATGARLDTIADAIFYSSMLIAIAGLIPERLLREQIWIAVAILSYFASWIASWLKFRVLPSYHTWMAKAAWFFVAPGMVLMALGWDVWLFRFAMVFVVLTNLEATLITRTLEQARVDVPSLFLLKGKNKSRHNELDPE